MDGPGFALLWEGGGEDQAWEAITAILEVQFHCPFWVELSQGAFFKLEAGTEGKP